MDNYDMSVFKKKRVLEKALKNTTDNYRPHDPGSYLYSLTFKYDFSKKFSHDFFELLYATLGAWNMNSRGAKLSSFDDFSSSILSHKNDFNKIKNVTIEHLDKAKTVLKKLFNELYLVDTQTPLVTFSKTLHFILPNLIAPIDRKYTLRFFYGKYNESCFSSKQKQFDVFWKIESAFSKFAQDNDLNKYTETDSWNRTIPKILDNAIIGFITPTILEENKEKK